MDKFSTISGTIPALCCSRRHGMPLDTRLLARWIFSLTSTPYSQSHIYTQAEGSLVHRAYPMTKVRIKQFAQLEEIS